jgi:hypothetical protein
VKTKPRIRAVALSAPAFALTLLFAVSCAPEPKGGTNDTDAAAAAAAEKPAPGGATAPAPASSPNQALRRLSVEAEGLRLFDPNTGAASALPFGTPRQKLLDVLEASRSPADTGTNSECGAGPLDYAAWADGLTLHFQEGKFAGWALDERAEGALATASGIGPGSTRPALDAAYQPTLSETSLGTEFAAGELYGVLSGGGPDARITALWAGVSCIFR